MADPKATPISALPKSPGGDEDQAFIQNILKQMNNDNQESEQAYQQVQQNYNKQQFAVNPAEQHAMNQRQMRQAQQAQQAQYEQMEDEQYDQYQEQEEVPLTFFEKLKMDIKAPIVFLILYFVLCLPPIRTFAATQIARFSQNANIQLYGSSLALGLVGSIIFYIINKFLIKF